MKIFFYMGRNSATKSGVSWKIWKIERKGCSVTTFWGPAALKKRKVIPERPLISKTRKFQSVKAACAFEEERIQNKLGKGYERRTRSRAT